MNKQKQKQTEELTYATTQTNTRKSTEKRRKIKLQQCPKHIKYRYTNVKKLK